MFDCRKDIGRHGGWIAVSCAVAAIIFFLPLWLNIPLLDPDEGLHASIAQEMVERGDLITPRQMGQPFLDKPILYFWAQAASLKLFGMHAAAVRLPGLLFGLFTAIATGVVGWRMFGPTTGYLAGLFYATMFLPAALAQAPSHDVALVPWICLAILAFWESDRASPRSAWLLSLVAGAALGAAVLTKGLVGVAMVGTAYGAWLLLTRRLTLSACLRGAAALAVAALVASSWYTAMEREHSGYLYYYFIERHVYGFATETQKHADSAWWYYLPILFGGGLPWISYLPATLRDAYCASEPSTADRHAPDAPPQSGGRPILLLLCWLIGCSVLMMAARSKLVTYVWPVFPAIALLAAVGWARLLRDKLAPAAKLEMGRTLVWSCRLGPLVLPLGIFIAQCLLHQKMGLVAWIATLFVGFASWIPLYFWRTNRLQAVAKAAPLVTAAQFALVLALVAPPTTAHFTARPLAEHYNRLGRLPDKLLVFEAEIGSLLFYLDSPLRRELAPGQLQAIDRDDLAKIGSEGVVAISGHTRGLLERRIRLKGLPSVEIGDYRLYEPSDIVPVLSWLPRRQRDSSESNQPGSGPNLKKQAPTSKPTAAPKTTSLK